MTPPIRQFKQALDQSTDRLREMAARGHDILGYFCTYTPVELIHAAGFIPVRIMAGLGSVTEADSLAPSFICPYMRRTLDRALKGEYDFLAGMVQGYTCDVACGMMNVWAENFPRRLNHTIPIPYNDTPRSRRYFAAGIEVFWAELIRAGGNLSPEKLAESINLYGRIRRLVLDLYQARAVGEFALSAAEFLGVIQAGFVLPPEKYLAMLLELAPEVSGRGGPDGVPVLVSGSLIEDPAVLDLVERAGGRVVADDLCTGFRHFQPATGVGDTPVLALIDRYMNRFPCPARSRAEDRAPLLLDLVERSGAEGVIFLFQKFCTPHLADHPYLVAALKEAGVPSVFVEMEETGLGEGRLMTRLQVFCEMLA